MANAINDIIKQSVNNINNMQQSNQQLQSILGQSQNKQTTGSQQLPSDLVLSPYEAGEYDQAMTGALPDVGSAIQNMIEPYGYTPRPVYLVRDIVAKRINTNTPQQKQPNYPELTNMLTSLSQQGQTALQNYISRQQNLAPSLFANTWESPNKDTTSINISLAGNQPKNKIMQQYENKYNEIQQQLDTQKQHYLNQLEDMRTNIQNSLNQLASPDTAKALIMGTTATYIQNAYNRIAPYMQPGDYNKLTQQLQDVYSKDQQFATSYNQLFQNYLGMNANLIDMLKQVQTNALQDIQQGAKNAVKLSYENYMNSDNGRYYPMSESDYMNYLSDTSGPFFRSPEIPNTIPNVTDMNSAIVAQRIRNAALGNDLGDNLSDVNQQGNTGG
jgi:acyl carrier protein phosphodiesterase